MLQQAARIIFNLDALQALRSSAAVDKWKVSDQWQFYRIQRTSRAAVVVD